MVSTEEIVQHTCSIFIHLFQCSAPTPYDKELACQNEQLLQMKASSGYFISETITFIMGRFDFYEEHSTFLFFFLDVLEKISCHTSIAEMLAEQSAITIIIERMKCYFFDSGIQIAALRTVENLKAAGNINGNYILALFSFQCSLDICFDECIFLSKKLSSFDLNIFEKF